MTIDFKIGTHPEHSFAREMRDEIDKQPFVTEQIIYRLFLKFLFAKKIHHIEYPNLTQSYILFKDGTYLKLTRSFQRITHEIGTYELTNSVPNSKGTDSKPPER